MIKTVRIISAALIVGAAAFFGAPVAADHPIIDFDSHTCSPEPSPSPPGEPELTPPPSADPTPTPNEPTPPPQNCMPEENERIWGTRTIKFSVETTRFRPLKRVALYILSDEKGLPHANSGNPLLEELFPSDPPVESYEKRFKWKSVEITPRNGRYKIRVVADTYEVTGGEHRTMLERKRLLVDNPPVALAAPRLIATTVDNVSLEWDTSTAPDVISYDVYRAKTSSREKKPAFADFKPIGSTAATTYRDPVPPGVYWYSVRVTRRSVVTPEKGISSPLSPMSWPADTKAILEKEIEKKDEKPAERRLQPYRPFTPTQRVGSRLANAPDAPFAYKLPYDKNVGALDEPMEAGTDDPAANDPRGPVLPVAVGMFLLSSALAVGRMPY